MTTRWLTGVQAYALIALRRDIRNRALVVAAVVGSILNVINQGEAIAYGSPQVVKLLLTYAVPFCVSIYSAVGAFEASK